MHNALHWLPVNNIYFDPPSHTSYS